MTGNVLGVDGTTLTLNTQPYYLQGLSFFNAIYNGAFNKSAGVRESRLRKFLENGVNTLRRDS